MNGQISCSTFLTEWLNCPEGKMKSREGTVVDADDLMQEMYENSKI